MACPGDRREEEAGQHTHSPESPCLSSPAGHVWPSPMAESSYGPAVKREAVGGWGSTSPGMVAEGVWEEEEDRYSAKRRQLAARAEQLQRAEEMVKQQEEEAQQRTWLALQQQEMLLREKEEALKLREAAAQRKLELAARLMEESRMMRESGRHTSDTPTQALCCTRRPPSPCPLSCPEDLPQQEASRTPGCRWPDTSPHPEGPSVFHSGREGGPGGLGRGRIYPAEHSIAEPQCSREASPRQQWRPGEGRPPSPRTAIPTTRQTETVKAAATPLCHPSEARLMRDSPSMLEGSPPNVQPHKVVRTYSRVGRSSLLSDAAASRPSPASQPREGKADPSGETVVHEGSSIPVTPLTQPPSRPRRPYSALPMLQTSLTHTQDTSTSNLSVTLPSPSSRGLTPVPSAASPASTSPARELVPRQLSLPPSLNLGSQQFTLKYVGTFKPEKRDGSASMTSKVPAKTSTSTLTPAGEERNQEPVGESPGHPPITPTLPKPASSPPRLSEAFCKPGHAVVAPKVTIMPRSPVVASASRPLGAPCEGKSVEVREGCWQDEDTNPSDTLPQVAVVTDVAATCASVPPPPPSPPDTNQTTTTTATQVDTLDTPTLQLIHGADSPFHPPRSHPPQPCHTPPPATHHHLPTTHLTPSPPSNLTPPDTQPSPNYPVCEGTPHQETADHSQTYMDFEVAPQPSGEEAQSTPEGSYPPQVQQQDVMGQPDVYEEFVTPSDTLRCSSPAFMHSLLSDSVAFHSTAIPSPNTPHHSTAPSLTTGQVTLTPSPPPASIGDQPGEGEGTSPDQLDSGVVNSGSQVHSPLFHQVGIDNGEQLTSTPDTCESEAVMMQEGKEEVEDVLPQDIEDEEDIEMEEVDVTGDGIQNEDSVSMFPANPTPEAGIEGGEDSGGLFPISPTPQAVAECEEDSSDLCPPSPMPEAVVEGGEDSSDLFPSSPTPEAVVEAGEDSSDLCPPSPTPEAVVEAGEDSSDELLSSATLEAVVEAGENRVQHPGSEDWSRLQPLTPPEEGEAPISSEGTAGEQHEEEEGRVQVSQEQMTNLDPVSVSVLEGDTSYQAEDKVMETWPAEVQPAVIEDLQEPIEVPSFDCQSECTVPSKTTLPEDMGDEGASECVMDSDATPTTIAWHPNDGTHLQDQSDTLLSGSLGAGWSQESHTNAEVPTTECDQGDPLTPESDEREPITRRRGRGAKGRQGRGRSKSRGQGRWSKRRNTSRSRQSHVDVTERSSEGDLSTHHSDTLTGDCVAPNPSTHHSDTVMDECVAPNPGSEEEAPQGGSLPPRTECYDSSLTPGMTQPLTQDMEGPPSSPVDVKEDESPGEGNRRPHQENSGVEEAVEHVSRGGRKVKLRKWWTGVVTEATSPRSKGTARSPVTSPVRSPGRSPSHRKPRMKRSPVEASVVPEPKRKCEEVTLETDLQVTAVATVVNTNTPATPITTTPATSTTQPEDTAMDADPCTPLTPVPTPSSDSSVVIKRRPGRQPKRLRPVKEYKPNPNEEKVDLECGKCGEHCYSRSHFLSHARMNHNGLARPKGESQEFSDAETQDVLAATMRAVKQLTCEVCNNIFRSLLGYRLHILACGVDPSQLNQTCEVCHRRIRYYYLEAHLKKHATQEAKKKKEVLVKVRGSRKAAQTCNMRLQAWRTTKVDEDASEGSSDPGDDFRQELKLTQYYTRIEPTLPPSLLRQWEASLEEGVGTTCYHEGCGHSASTMAEARQHHWVCPLAGHSQVFTCKLCSFTFEKEEEMEEHITSTHMDQVMGELEESESEGSDDEYEEYSASQRSHNYRRVSKDSLLPFLPAMRWTYDFLSENICSSLFPEYIPWQEEWLALPDTTAALYLPAITSSPKFRVQLVRKEKVPPGQKEVPGEAEWQELGRFESATAGQGSAMFCGGPVTASAWCPVGPKTSLTSSMQYLALATLSSPDMKHQICRSYSHAGLIQVWGCPGPANTDLATPRFLLGLGHDHGTVWSLAWCPSGSEEAMLPDQADSSLPRLGLLAAACSDGSVLMYAVPRPEALQAPGRVYKPPACLTLLPGRGGSREVQCFKVDWCRAKGHHLVAGALSSGVVCIWDLGTTSHFLRNQQGSVLYPFRAFHAHNGICTTVAFCPTTGGRNLLSGGNDRTYKFWDLEHPELPLSVVRKGLVLDSLWLTHWAGCFLAFDDVYGLTSTNTCFKESGFFGISSRNVLSSNSAVWTLAGSDWLNSVAQGDSAGEVTLTVQQQLFRNYENEKFPSKRKVPVMCVRLQGLSAHTPISFSSTRVLQHSSRHPLPKNLKKPRQEEEEDCLGQNLYQEFPQTYQDTQDTYGLVFRDQNLTNFSTIPKEELQERWRSECMEASTVTCYPMMAVTSLAWNNNLGAHTWLLMATQSGIARLARVEALHSRAVNNFIQDNFGPGS